jgi:serine/threonine protein kinase
MAASPAPKLLLDRGVTGFVEFDGDAAHKYIELWGPMYAFNELAVLTYLQNFATENIVKFTCAEFVKRPNPKNSSPNEYGYLKLTFPRYTSDLNAVSLYEDQQIIQIMLDLTSALKFLHSEQIIHRDIKKGNIMMHNKRAILIDFSHSHKRYLPIEQMDIDVYTFDHRPPEVYLDDGYDCSADMWAIGILLFDLVCVKEMHKLLPSKKYPAFPIEQVEREFKEILLSGQFLQIVRDYYGSYRRSSFNYSDIYFKWITALLQFDPAKRITASDLYYEILRFAQKRGIPHKIPRNGEPIGDQIKPTIKIHQIGTWNEPEEKGIQRIVNNCNIVEMEQKHNQILLNECLDTVSDLYDRLFSVPFDVDDLKKILEYMISVHEITEKNYKYSTIAICIIFRVVYLDDKDIHIDQNWATDMPNYNCIYYMGLIATRHAPILFGTEHFYKGVRDPL